LARDRGRTATAGSGRHRTLDESQSKAEENRRGGQTKDIGLGSESGEPGKGRVNVGVYAVCVGVRLYLLAQPLLSEGHDG